MPHVCRARSNYLVGPHLVALHGMTIERDNFACFAQFGLSTGVIHTFIIMTDFEGLGQQEELIAALAMARVANDGLAGLFAHLRVDAHVRLGATANLFDTQARGLSSTEHGRALTSPKNKLSPGTNCSG